MDADGDGALSSGELAAHFEEHAVARSWGRLFESERESTEPERPAAPSGAPEGAVAPDFTLSSPDGAETVTLSDFAGVKPVALVFGSYT